MIAGSSEKKKKKKKKSSKSKKSGQCDSLAQDPTSKETDVVVSNESLKSNSTSSTLTVTHKSTLFPRTSHEVSSVIFTPNTSYLASEVMLAPAEAYRPFFDLHTEQIRNLAKKSIRDYVQFLSYFHVSLKPFLHPVVASTESTPSCSPKISNSPPLASMKSISTEMTTLNGQNTLKYRNTLTDFIMSLTAKTMVMTPNHFVSGDTGSKTHRHNDTCFDPNGPPPEPGTYHPLVSYPPCLLRLHVLIINICTCIF